MSIHISGLHHVTAISGPPQPNVDFFTGTLGQRLVKKTVNFDAPDTYHLYYGNRDAEPGTILTFFPFANAAPGRAGPGMASAYAYAVPEGHFDTWIDTLASNAIDIAAQTDRFGERVIILRDPDGAPVELVETDHATDAPLDGFHSVTLWEDDIAPTARVLIDHFGWHEAGHEATDGTERLRLRAPGKPQGAHGLHDSRGTIVDILRTDAPAPARKQGAGTIHHVAFRARDSAEQLEWQENLKTAGFDVSNVRDRQYFNAIYFREPGGVLFEIATDPPGFATDEDPAHLGEALKLPPQYEDIRDDLERVLPPLRAPLHP